MAKKHLILTDEELAQAKATAKKRHEAEQKQRAIDLAVAAEMDRLDYEMQLASGERQNEMVTLTLDLPTFADRIVLDGRIFLHGFNHTIRRVQADTLMEMAQRLWHHQFREVEGKKLRDFYQSRRGTVLNSSGQTLNPPQRNAG